MAKVVKGEVHAGGMEWTVQNLGSVFLFIGIATLVVSLIVAVYESSALWLIFGLLALFEGTVIFVVFRAGAEVLRLLKKQSGLLYSGEISQPRPAHVYLCSECGAEVWASNTAKKCDKCKAVFDR